MNDSNVTMRQWLKTCLSVGLLAGAGALVLCAGCGKGPKDNASRAKFEVDKVYERGPASVHVRLDKTKLTIADTVLLFRFFEAVGEVRQALSVVKKRTGHHERSIRELVFGVGGLRVGPPLTNVRGVLSGNPVFLKDGSAGGEGEPRR